MIHQTLSTKFTRLVFMVNLLTALLTAGTLAEYWKLGAFANIPSTNRQCTGPLLLISLVLTSIWLWQYFQDVRARFAMPASDVVESATSAEAKDPEPPYEP